MPLAHLRVATNASPLLQDLLSKTPASQQQALEALISEAATSNGDRYLSADELGPLLDAFAGSPQMSASDFARISGNVGKLFSERASSAATRGVEAHFMNNLEGKLINELNSAVQRAGGRKLDINMMIFEFQSDAIEEAITQIARANPNVTFRIIGDSGQASASGGNALPSLLKKKLPNVHIKFKKDFPFAWNADRKMPVYSHASTSGLNHHKGFVTVIDGKVDRLVCGSFNWSKTANEKNYEDMVVMHALDEGTRAVAANYQDEFVGFFNNDEATLSAKHLAAFKREKWNEMAVKNGAPPLPVVVASAADQVAKYEPVAAADAFDVNAPTDQPRLASLLGAQLLQAVTSERAAFGRFASFGELSDRVAGITALPSAARDALLGAYYGIDAGARAVDVHFNSRPYGAPAAGTGYGAVSGSRLVETIANDGSRTDAPATIFGAATNLLNRAQPGAELLVAMYGMSASSKETKALFAAAARGVQVRVILNDDNNGPMAEQLKAAGIDVRIQKARTMHEKFAVTGDEVFFGSANFSDSSSTKHSEDRFTVRGDTLVADGFRSQFERIWEKSKEV